MNKKAYHHWQTRRFALAKALTWNGVRIK